jgi:uncharacterized tellurite resistance protein B-like protein
MIQPKETSGRATPEEKARTAVCVVLLEAAMADEEFTEEERVYVLDVLQHQFSLNADEAQELMMEAEDIRRESLDLWQFTNAINQAFSTEEKEEIVEYVWRIIYSDGVLTGHEDHLAHKLRTLFNLNHQQLIRPKLRVLEELRGQSGAD